MAEGPENGSVGRRGFLLGAVAAAWTSGKAFAAPDRASVPGTAFDRAAAQLGAMLSEARTELDWHQAEVKAREIAQQGLPRETLERLEAGYTANDRQEVLPALGAAYLRYLASFDPRWGRYDCALTTNLAGRLVNASNVTACRSLLREALSYPEADVRANLYAIDLYSSMVSTRTYLIEWVLDWAGVSATIPELNGDMLLCPTYNCPPYQYSSYQVVGAKSHAEINIAGNKVLRITPGETGRAVVRNLVTTVPTDVRPQLNDFDEGSIPAPVKRYLKSCATINLNHPAVQQLADELRGTTKVVSIRNALHWINTKLKSNPDNRDGSIEGILRHGSQHCESNITVMTGLLRALGVPARLVRGWGGMITRSVFSDSPGVLPPPHTFGEFYVPGAGWIAWDVRNPAFAPPAYWSVGIYRYFMPQAVLPTQPGDPATNWLWREQHRLCDSPDYRRTRLILQTLEEPTERFRGQFSAVADELDQME